MPVRPPSLRSIAAFEAAARHQSFTRAASELNLTTGAVSHAIKALETRLDRKLFERSGGRMSLTPEGQSLVARVRLSLSLLGEAFDVAPWLEQDVLTVSTLSSVADKILVPALADLRDTLPGLTIDLRCDRSLADLESGIDVAIRFGAGLWSGVQSRFLAEERLVPVASPSYRGGAVPRTLEELLSCDLIRHSQSSWTLWLEPIGGSSAEFRSSLFLDDSALVIEAAAAGMGIALARLRLAEADLRSGRLVRLFDHDVAAEYSYWAVWSGSSPKQRLIGAFVDWLEQRFRAADEFPSSPK